MKKTIHTLLFSMAIIFSTNLSAVVYTYNGTWSNSDGSTVAPTTLNSGDEINIASGTFSQSGNMLLKGNTVVNIATGAQWTVANSDTLKTKCQDFNIDGSLVLKNTAYLNIKSSSIVNISGTLKQKSSSNTKVSSNSTINVNDGGTWVVRNSSTTTNNGNIAAFGTLRIKETAVFTNKATIIGTGIIDLQDDINGFVNTNANASVNGINGASAVGLIGDNDLGAPLGAPTEMTAIFQKSGSLPSVDSTIYVAIQDSLIVSSDVTIGILYVQANDTMVIQNGSSVTVSYAIINAGVIIVESGASLVQGAAANNNKDYGIYIVEQTGGQMSNLAYNVWSSPISNADLQTVYSATNPCDMFVLNGSTQEWLYDFSGAGSYTCNGNTGVDLSPFLYTDGIPDGTMDAGRGYFIPGDATSTAKDFSGVINNGNVSVTIYSTNITTPGAWAGNDWNLVGNPYPSSIDPASFWATNSSKLTDGLYFYDHSIGDYAVWSSGGGTTTDDFQISVGQGFNVLTDDAIIADGTSGTISFENSMRSTEGGSFYKNEVFENHNVSMSISTPSGQQNNIVVGYSNNATNGFDKSYDAHKISGNANIRFASVLNKEEMIIQNIARLSYGESKTIALVVFTAETGIHTFEEYRRENIVTGMNVFLKDNTTGLMHDLTKGDYSVNLDANTEYANRFELVFENTASKNDDSNSGELATGVEAVKATDYVLLNDAGVYTITNSNGVKGDVRVVSVTGSVVWSKNNVNTTSLQINMNGVSSGIYLVQVIDNNESVYSTKVVK